MIDKEAYSLRIMKATPAQLVVINFEITIDYLNEALARFNDRDSFEPMAEKAKSGLSQLIQSLNFDVSLSHDLYALYQYIYKLLNDALFGHKREPAEEALGLLNTLLEGWRDAEGKETEAVPVIGELPQVYAGLTYQRGGLSEYVEQDESRGYKA